MKTYTIKMYHKGRVIETKGNLEELTKYFSYTLECGNSYNDKIARQPKTIRSLMSGLEKSVHETQGCCYNQDRYELVA